MEVSGSDRLAGRDLESVVERFNELSSAMQMYIPASPLIFLVNREHAHETSTAGLSGPSELVWDCSLFLCSNWC